MPRRPTDETVKIEDLLREEYFDLLSEIRRAVWELETEIRHHTLRIVQTLKPPEQVIIKSRVKECESAVNSLRANSNGRVFDPEQKNSYSILNLPDLAGVRVLVFPNNRLVEVDETLRSHFSTWTSKPVKDAMGNPLAPKYHGYFDHLSPRVGAEYQVVPMLLGLFWEVEHSAMYKSQIASNSENMKHRRAAVEAALSNFEEGIASLLPDNSQPS
jgi:ppGpp synthetase/RelA/SpoT-type nucleotidyltranferase